MSDGADTRQWPLFQDNVGKLSPKRILMKQEMMWQWHRLDHMQIICTLLQTYNMPAPHPLISFGSWMLFLMPNQQHHRTEGNSTEGK